MMKLTPVRVVGADLDNGRPRHATSSLLRKRHFLAVLNQRADDNERCLLPDFVLPHHPVIARVVQCSLDSHPKIVTRNRIDLRRLGQRGSGKNQNKKRRSKELEHDRSPGRVREPGLNPGS